MLALLLLSLLGGSGNTGGNSPIDRLLKPAQGGDRQAREDLLSAYTPLVLRVGSQVSGRYLAVGRDEEVSVGLMALNEAIDRFDPSKGASFISFAELVIKRRLLDHYRRQKENREIPMSGLEAEDDEGRPLERVERLEAMEQHAREEEAAERRDEIARYARRLAEFGVKFSDLVAASPKHEDARQRAIEAARVVAGQPLLAQHLLTRRELPLKQLEEHVGVSRKTLERQRKYIIAVTLILLEDFYHLRRYIGG